MDYEQQIVSILADVGEKGISARLLTRHVYNMNRTLFAEPDKEEIYDFVRKFLKRNYKSSQPLLERAAKRGYYRLNPRSAASARQMQLDFDNAEPSEEEKEAKPEQDLSLKLFPEI
jgi:hypothetical protein